MNKARLTFLGTGTSQGVPIIGCQCNVCKSTDLRDKRYRSSVLVEYEGLTILVDAGPDFRSQMIRADVRHLDAIFLTHNHKDHTGGLDDVRSLNYIDRVPMMIYCEEKVLKTLKTEYAYAFAEDKYPGSPEWKIRLIDDRPFMVYRNRPEGELTWIHDKGYCLKMPDGSMIPTGKDMISDADYLEDPSFNGQAHSDEPYGVEIIPIRGYHDTMPVLGFRFGDIAYITDMSKLPESEFVKLQGLEHVTLNTVGYKQHHSHFSLDEAIDIAQKIGAKHTWLTHLSHTFPVYDDFCAELDKRCKERGCTSSIVRPAYDGLVLG